MQYSEWSTKKTNTSLLVIVIMHVVLRPSFAGAIASKEEPALETEHKPLFIQMQENFDEACHAKTVNKPTFIPSNFILRLTGDKLVHEPLIFMTKHYICLSSHNFTTRLVGGN